MVLWDRDDAVSHSFGRFSSRAKGRQFQAKNRICWTASRSFCPSSIVASVQHVFFLGICK
jgi:hypothetical protein